MTNLTSSLTVKLIDEATKPARSIGQALKDSEKQIQAVAKAMANTGSTDRFTASLGKLKLSAKDIETVAAAWKTYSASAKLAANASDWTKTQAAGVKRWESQTISALKAVQREQAAFARASKRAMSGEGETSGRRLAAGLAGGYIAHSTAHFAKESLETYREFDKERRFGRAVMGISDKDQEALVKQAIHMGGSTRFNDIQVLEAQRELAARGLKRDSILGMMPSAADLGTSLDLSLPEAVKQMEGAIFGFKKNIETTADAMASARQTADLQVKAAKISGMTPEDIRETYKYGATPARMSGVSEQMLLAFAAISKKANMGGDEAGVAFRALMSASQSPTRGAREALLANGLDYKNYQRPVGNIAVDPFVRNVAAQYGVALNQKAVSALTKVFTDPKLLNDPAKFTPAVVDALGGTLGKKDAKNLKSIAGMANRFRNASGGGADVNAFLADLMKALPGNIKLANALFGSKQGARIANALGDPATLKHMIEELTGHADGYSKNVADQRNAGYDGAMSRLEGAIKTLQSTLGRAFDADGKGGLLTDVTSKAGQLVQALAEAPPHLLRLGTEAGAVASIFAGMKGAEALLGGFGLKSAATTLTRAGELLIEGATKQNLANGLPGGPDKNKKGPLSRAGRVLGTVAGIATGVEVYNQLTDAAHDAGLTPSQYDPKRPVFHSLPPPSSRPPANPFGDLSGVTTKSEEAKASLAGLNTTVAPNVDASSIAAAQTAAKALLATLMQIQGAASGAASAVRGINVPSLGKIQRGDFSYGGVGGGD